MNGYSTVTQKGQVAIPKPIRDFLGLKPSDKVYFEIKNDSLVARRVFSIEEIRGIVGANKVLTKKDNKKIIKNATVAKFKRKNKRE